MAVVPWAGRTKHSKREICPILRLFPSEYNHFPWSHAGPDAGPEAYRQNQQDLGKLRTTAGESQESKK